MAGIAEEKEMAGTTEEKEMARTTEEEEMAGITTRLRAIWLITVIVMMAVLGTACTADGDDAADDQTETTAAADDQTETTAAADDQTETTAEESREPAEGAELTFTGFYAADNLEPFLAAWEAHRPDVPVTYQEVPFDELNTVLESRLGAGDATPDVFTADQPRIANLVQRGLLLDITDEVGDVEEIFLPAGIEASSVDGRLYALPVNSSTQFIYANMELLEAAGIDPPSADPSERWTWAETVEAAQAAQAAGAGWGLQLEQISRIYQIQPLPESLGGGSGLTGDDFMTPDFTNDGWVEAMEFYAAIHEGVSPRGVPAGETRQLFIDGQVALFVGGPWNIGIFDAEDSAVDFEYAVGAHPYFDGGEPVTPTGSWSWAVNPNSEHQEAAIEFIRFATENLDGSLALVESDPNIPANLESLERYVQADALQREFDGVTIAELMQYELENTAVIRAPSAGFIIYEELVGAALEDIRNGEPIQETLERLEQDLADALSRQ